MTRPIQYGPGHMVRLTPGQEAAFQAWKKARPLVRDADLLRELVEMGLNALQTSPEAQI